MREPPERRLRQSRLFEWRLFSAKHRRGLIGSSGFNTPITAGPLAGSCTANVERTQELTVGFWQQLYKGDLGQVRVGAQYEFVRLQAFAGTGTPLHGAPALTAGPTPNAGLNPYNNVVYFSLRYYPFN